MNKKSAIRARRAHIIDAALACFLEKGFNQTGIRDIAKRAEISLGNLYNHFPSKKAVLIEIASMEDEDIDGFLELLSDHDDHEQTLRRFLSDYTDYCNQADYVTLTFELMGEAIRDKEISDLFIANHTRLIHGLAALLQAGQAAGCFREQKDNREIAEILLDSIGGYAARMVLGMSEPKAGSDVLHTFLMSSVLD